jgi:hypothetical protein
MTLSTTIVSLYESLFSRFFSKILLGWRHATKVANVAKIQDGKKPAVPKPETKALAQPEPGSRWSIDSK